MWKGNSYLYIIFLWVSFLLIACDKQVSINTETSKTEAQAIADSIKDVDALTRYAENYHKAGDRKSEAIVRTALGIALRNLCRYDEAIAQHDSCISMAHGLNDTLLLIESLNHQGTNYRRLVKLQEASTLHYSALELSDKYSDSVSAEAYNDKAISLNCLGNVHQNIGNYEMAMGFFRRSLSMQEKTNCLEGMSVNNANIGKSYESLGNLDSARVYYLRALDYNRQNKDKWGESLCLQHLGDINAKQGKNVSAHEYYLLSYQTGLPTGDHWHILNTTVSIAQLYIKEQRADSAVWYLDSGLKEAENIRSFKHLSALYRLRSELYESTGNYKQALHDQKMHEDFEDSLSLNDSELHLQSLRVKYESGKLIQMIHEAEMESGYEKRLYKITIGVGLFVLVVICIIVAQQIRVNWEHKRVAGSLEKLNAERLEFYRGVTHQLRTPLTVVVGLTQELLSELPTDNVSLWKKTDAVARQSKQLLSLLSEMIVYNATGKVDGKLGDMDTSAVTPSEESESRELIAPSSRYILLAEDNPDIALLITEMLKNEGFRCFWAHDGMEALEVMEQRLPDMLITDIMMPRMDGIELMRCVREDEEKAHIPIVVVSARVQDEERLEGIKAGAEVYISKPFVPNELMMIVKRLLEQRRVLRDKYETDIKNADMKARENITGMVPHDATEGDRQLIGRIEKCINDNIENPDLCAAFVSNSLHINLNTLNQCTMQVSGMDMGQYIRFHKLERSRSLLIDTALPIGEICSICGFESPYYFSRAFKMEYGISPSEYRKQNQA